MAAEETVRSHEVDLREAREWATLLEVEESTLRRESEQLPQALFDGQSRERQTTSEMASRLAAAEAEAREARAENQRLHAQLETAAATIYEAREASLEQGRAAQALRRSLEQTQIELASARQAVEEHATQRQTLASEVARLSKLNEAQRQEIASLRADDRQVAEDRAALRRLQRYGEEQQRELETLRREARHSLKELHDLHEERETLHEEALRREENIDALIQQRDSLQEEADRLRTKIRGIPALEERLGIQQKQIVRLESERDMLAAQVAGLSTKLSEAEASIKAWTRGQQSTALKTLVDGLVEVKNAYVASVTGVAPNPTPPAQAVPPPKPQPSQPPSTSRVPAPSISDEEQIWRERIRAAQAKGWKVFGDSLVSYKRDEFRHAEQIARNEIAAGRAVTNPPLPPGADLEYRAIRAAIDLRVNYHRDCGGRWVIEYFELDQASEKTLRRTAMMRAAQMRRTAMGIGRLGRF